MAQYLQWDSKTKRILCKGHWDVSHLSALHREVKSFRIPNEKSLTLDGSGIQNMDSAGALILSDWTAFLTKSGFQVQLENFSSEQRSLLHLVERKTAGQKPAPKIRPMGTLEAIGRGSLHQFHEFKSYLAFVGYLTMEAFRSYKKPDRLRYQSLASVIYRNGYQALPIIALLSLMIGVVITYQMGLQLQNYGANVYIVDLLGISVLREFGPLLTAIMVAGRTGSAFTAQLGMMKLNQEIDALDTMGVTPAQLLILPRIMGLFILLPLLTIWADIFGVLGGMLMSNNMLGISWYDFVKRFPHVIELKTLFMGLGKAPVFALLIGSIGCFQGMKVYGGADSVGRNTTRSVVLAIFFIIVADAAFSVVYSELGL